MTREVFLALTAYRRRTLLDLLVKSQGTLPIEALHLALLATGHRYVERQRAASHPRGERFVFHRVCRLIASQKKSVITGRLDRKRSGNPPGGLLRKCLGDYPTRAVCSIYSAVGNDALFLAFLVMRRRQLFFVVLKDN